MAVVRNWLVSLCVADGASVHVPLAGRKGAESQRDESPAGAETEWTNCGLGLTGLMV